MITMLQRAAIAASVVALAACASVGQPVSAVRSADGMFTNVAGMTLYTFDKDAAGSGKSVCNGQCATLWPPHMADGMAMATGEWSIATRDDGKKQWAYKGKPLYTWVKDTKPGDKTGDGVGNAWRIARP